MRDRLKILKWLGCLFLLCLLWSTMAFSESTSKYIDNRATIAKMTHENAIVRIKWEFQGRRYPKLN